MTVKPSYPIVAEPLGGCTLHQLSVRGDQRGALVALQARELQADLARVYYIFNTLPGIARGFHAHRRLHQFVVPICGSCAMVLDNGTERTRVVLDRPDHGLSLPPMIWHEMMDFSPGHVLLVLANAPYEEADYIKDYEAFLAEVRS